MCYANAVENWGEVGSFFLHLFETLNWYFYLKFNNFTFRNSEVETSCGVGEAGSRLYLLFTVLRDKQGSTTVAFRDIKEPPTAP